MTVAELIVQLEAFEPTAPVVTDCRTSEHFQTVRGPEAGHALPVAGGMYSGCHAAEEGAIAVVYMPAHGY